MNEDIDISGLSKVRLLQALYAGASPVGLGVLHYNPDSMSKEMAKELLKGNCCFDYLSGRSMKVDLSGNALETWLYDRDNGEGAAAAAVSSVRDEVGSGGI